MLGLIRTWRNWARNPSSGSVNRSDRSGRLALIDVVMPLEHWGTVEPHLDAVAADQDLQVVLHLQRPTRDRLD